MPGVALAGGAGMAGEKAAEFFETEAALFDRMSAVADTLYKAMDAS